MSVIKNHFNSQKLEVPFCAWKLHEQGVNELVELVLQAREFIDTHKNPVPVFFYILNGSGTLTIDGKAHLLGESDSIYVEKDLDRKLENTGAEGLKVLVIKQIA